MRPVRLLLIYAGFVFLGGALLAPWLYGSVQLLADHFPALAKMAGNPFHRFVNRSLLAMALIGLWPFLRGLGVRTLRDIGVVKPAGEWHRIARGGAVGFCSLSCVAGIVLAAGARTMNGEISALRLGEKIAGAAATAIIVALMEEVLFRGGIFGALRKTCRWPVALAVSSVVYAGVHFFGNADPSADVSWTSGFAALPLMLRGFVDVQQVVPGFFNLTMAGALLALAYQRTGNLYFSVGLHAGWIFWLKSYGFLTRGMPGADVWFWGTSKMIDGWLALPVLAAVLIVVGKLLPGRESGGNASSE
jgi:membrane protease YdiL (CAAX protease family)